MSYTTMSIRMDNDVKQQAQALFAEFGLDMTTAINMFLRQSLRERAIPFRICQLEHEPNEQTRRALLEADRLLGDPHTKRYTAEEALAELKR